MSDVSQGAGWWLASDGKWYAPYLHPNAQRAASVDSLPTFSEGFAPSIGQRPLATAPTTFYANAPSAASTSGLGRRIHAGRSSAGKARFAISVVGLVVLVGAISAGIILVTNGKSPPVAIQSPAEANSAVYAAASDSGSFHYTVSSTGTLGGNPVTGSQSGDVGRGEGVQYMTSPLGDYEVIVIHSMAYMKPNLTMLENTFGYSPSEAAALSGRWISFTPSDAPYNAVAADVTTETTWNNPGASPTDGLPQTPVSVSGLSSLNGQSVQSVRYSLHGTSKTANASYSGSETIVFSATNPHLPTYLSEQLSGSVNQQSSSEVARVTFNQWGEPVTLAAPTGSIPYSSLPGTGATA